MDRNASAQLKMHEANAYKLTMIFVL